MKKIIFLMLIAAVVFFSCSKDKTSQVTESNLTVSDLPVQVTTYISDNYPDASIYQAVMLKNSSATYIVTLTTEEELAFDKDGRYIGNGYNYPGEGDPGDPGDTTHHGHPGPGHGHGHHHGHPPNFIPADSLSTAIKSYIATNYAGYTIQGGMRDSICPFGAVTGVMLIQSDTSHLKLFFNATDNFVMTGNRVHYATTPKAIKDYITTNYTDYHVCHGTELLTLADNSVEYAIYLDKPHTHKRIVIAADGTFICEQEMRPGC